MNTPNPNPAAEWMKMYQDWMEGMMRTSLESTRHFASMAMGTAEAKSSKVPCCPPDIECPPHCLMTLYRKARAGEVIVELFAIKNCCGKRKTYRLGARPLLDPDGNAVDAGVELDKSQVDLDQGRSVVVRARVDTSGLQPGTRYTADIVMREQEVNQNVCFVLDIEPEREIPEVCPKEEAWYFNRFHSWESHYYCEKPRSRVNITRIG